jgi:hypothetical protein
MDQLGWDSCDIILVTGDAYVDHPSFGMAICGRMLEAQGSAWGLFPAGLEQQRRLYAPGQTEPVLRRPPATWTR